MSVVSLDIKGFRGFGLQQTLRLAQPNETSGSGITILVGPNSGGKSTIVEAFKALSGREVSFSEGKRNKDAGDRVWIRVGYDGGETQVLQTSDQGGSTTIHEPKEGRVGYVLPSRRYFYPYFGQSAAVNRKSYLSYQDIPANRGNPIGDFAEQRLFAALENREEFNAVLGQVMAPVPDWTIDQSDEGRFYLKLNSAGQIHNSDGLGEGIVSLLFLVDALYDSLPGDLIVIDEPEFSLHPLYQRRLTRLLGEYARNRQIVYATHSPYFIEFEYILNGAEVARVHKYGDCCYIDQLCRNTANELKGLLRDSHNPHVLGLNARESLFLEDGVIVVEGQDDVVYYPRILDQLVAEDLLKSESASFMKERFFGWGAGGAEKIERILAVLKDLGFTRVAAIFDKNKCSLIPDLENRFPDFFFGSIPAGDIRAKDDHTLTSLLDANYRIRPEFKTDAAKLFQDVCKRIQS